MKPISQNPAAIASRKWRAERAAEKVIRYAVKRFENNPHSKQHILDLHKSGKDVATIVIRLRVPASVVIETIRQFNQTTK